MVSVTFAIIIDTEVCIVGVGCFILVAINYLSYIFL